MSTCPSAGSWALRGPMGSAEARRTVPGRISARSGGVGRRPDAAPRAVVDIGGTGPANHRPPHPVAGLILDAARAEALAARAALRAALSGPARAGGS
ncbi:hypothetical protein [Streptomyces sp. CB00072]|uniref:hypothetical protein n=1 Tax=Streptomyces sp. CB00072 TaxID=1703928 RepID=UPI00116134C6|nr:hypothetical protein [Streptomyces sp. CB00072]